MKNHWRPVLATVMLAIGGLPFLGSPSSDRAGYVDSSLCAKCHSTIYESYQRTGMARSFYRPSPGRMLENFRTNNSYRHRASGTYFTMIERDGKYFQRRYQTGFQGKEVNIDEKQIDFVMGSGNHVRTYLHRTSAGALQQLPLAWYAERGGYWAMNPGYDKPDQPNARRKISLECMFCHNAYPEVRGGHEQLRAEPLFSGAMPEGIDCQRCHGPGGRHVELAQTRGAASEAVAQAIINPARLTPERQMEICMQCHLETTSFQFPHSILKYERRAYSYRPGEPLGDFMLFFDHGSTPSEDRFQIVNSAYRLRMSLCFRKSNGALQCTTCHDPHNTSRGESAAKQHERACMRCHAASLRQMVADRRHTESTDCAGCHMPKRRTTDVVHAIMTDHFIQRRKPEGNLVAEISEPHGPGTVYHGEVLPYYPEPLPRTAEHELYVALAQVREDNNSELGMSRFAAAIAKYKPSQPEFHIELAEAYARHGKPGEAIPLFEEAARRRPESLAAHLGLGRAFESRGDITRAAAALRRAAEVAPDDPSAWLALGQVYFKQGDKQEAGAALEKSARLDPEIPETHYSLGLLWSQPAVEAKRAEESFREAIRLKPDYPEAHMNLAILLFQKQFADEAAYHFESALRLRRDYALAHLNYGLMLSKLNRAKEAKQHLEQAAASTDSNVRDAARRLLNQVRR